MQDLIAYVIVAAAACYAAWWLVPQSLRHWLIGRLMVVAPSRRAWLARLEAEEAENSGCSSCRGCAADGRAPAAPGRSKIEVRQRHTVE